jgi:hypothetical protein
MDPFTDLLKGLKHEPKSPLPKGFEEKVVFNWFNKTPKKQSVSIAVLYAIAACFTVFTLTNILLYKSSSIDFGATLSVQNESNNTEHVSSELEFAEAYGFVETSYYTLNK